MLPFHRFVSNHWNYLIAGAVAAALCFTAADASADDNAGSWFGGRPLTWHNADRVPVVEVGRSAGSSWLAPVNAVTNTTGRLLRGTWDLVTLKPLRTSSAPPSNSRFGNGAPWVPQKKPKPSTSWFGSWFSSEPPRRESTSVNSWLTEPRPGF